MKKLSTNNVNFMVGTGTAESREILAVVMETWMSWAEMCVKF